MRASTKTISFDFHFDYPSNGQYASANTITVCEPGFDHRDVFRRMGRWAAESDVGLFKQFAHLKRDEAAIEREVEKKKDESGVEDDNGLSTLRIGLSGEEFEKCVKYIETVLTNNKRLAYVGTDADNRIPVTEEVWRNICDQAGLLEMERVLGAFASFFTGTPSARKESPTQTGTASPSGSGAPPKGGSRTKMH